MTDKKSFSCGTIVAGVITAGAMSIYASGIGTGYLIWGRGLDQIKETQRTSICTKELEPVWRKFQEGCAKKTVDTLYNGSLDQVVKQRKEIVERLDCPSSIEENTWKCSYNVSEGKFEADETEERRMRR